MIFLTLDASSSSASVSVTKDDVLVYESYLNNGLTHSSGLMPMVEDALRHAGTWLIIDEGHITNIAVHPDKRGKGYGTKVTSAMMQAAVDVGVQYMTLEVRVSNEPALALYKKLGFKKAGVRKKYYEDNGEDAYIMVNDRLQQSIDRANGKKPVY